MAKTAVAPNPNVGRNIEALMKARVGLATQQALARRTGVGQSTIGRIVRGESNPTSDNLRKIADAFSVTVDVLYQSADSFARFLHTLQTGQPDVAEPIGTFDQLTPRVVPTIQ